jgi:hypothetical protein
MLVVNTKQLYPLKLPASILSCTTLLVLKLRWFYVDKVSPFPFRFPSLKTLDLKHMYFDQCPDFTLLLDGCPVLEDLQVSYIHFNNSFRPFDFEQFENSSLRKLKRADTTDCYFHFPVKVLANVEFLRVKLWKVCLIIMIIWWWFLPMEWKTTMWFICIFSFGEFTLISNTFYFYII